MNLAFLPIPDQMGDCAGIRVNGMWYQEWQGGYHDILKRGYPRPKYSTTVLAELHSPLTPDFLHGGDGDVPFLVSARAMAVIRKNRLSGVQFSRVEIVKIATKGKHRGRSRGGEPEDVITKARDRSSIVDAPKLYAARVAGRFEIVPDYPTGKYARTDYVTPYELPAAGKMPDLWRPTIRGRTFAAWTYCSQRFRDVVEKHALSNIDFEAFDEHMSRFREEIEAELSEPG
ncbi:MAG TPA: hypothetical protein VGP72_21280 [Planctomycetota bacterium]|jgi:hypothetical protein